MIATIAPLEAYKMVFRKLVPNVPVVQAKLMLSRIAMCFGKAQMGLEVKSSLSLSDTMNVTAIGVSQIRASAATAINSAEARKHASGDHGSLSIISAEHLSQINSRKHEDNQRQQTRQ